jgi:hypothetical protein
MLTAKKHSRPQGSPGRAGSAARHSFPRPCRGATEVKSVPETTSSDHPALTLEDVGREFPAWLCYSPGINGVVFARLRDHFPLVILRGNDPASLCHEIQRWAD